MDTRSQAYASRRQRYRPPPFGFSDVRSYINKFEAPKTIVKSKDREIEKYTECQQKESYFGDFPFDDSASSGETVVWKIVFLKLGGIVYGYVPKVTFGSLGAFAVAAGVVAPKMITYLLLYPFCRLVFGTLYPAYASYKAVRTKNLKEYVKWMMYWIVFALFTCAETFTDVFLSWFPFYYEIKIILVLWLLSPATKGSSILYRKFVHPALSRREQEIDDAIAKAKEQGYHTVLNLGSRGVNYATTVIMQTAIRGGGGLVQQLKKSYSLSDLTDSMPHSRSEQDMVDEADDVLTDPHLIRRSVARSGYNTRRSASESNNRTPLYFSEVDVDVRPTRASHPQDFSHIKSSDDISSGYSSADNSATREQGLSRTGSVGGSGKLRSRQITTRSTVTTIKRPGAAEGNEVIIEELHDNDSVDYENLPALLTLPPTCHISRTNPPFLFEYVGNEIRIIKILGDVSPNFVTVGDDLNIQQSSNSVTDSAYKPENDVPKMEVEENFKICENSDITKTEVFFETMSDADQLPKKVNINEGTTHVNKNSTNVPSLVENEELSNETDKVITKTEDIANTTITLSNDELKLKRESSVSFEKKVNDFLTAERKCSHSTSSSNVSLNSAKTDQADVGSIGTSSLNDDAAETDDEASYGTPEDSPKAKKKTARGKYGKSRAPAPPNIYESKVIQDNMITDARSSISEDENKPPSSITSNLLLDSGAMKEFGTVAIHSVKPTESDTYGHISKTNCKSKSPAGRKAGGSSITRFMQLPGKLAFWHKTDDKDKSEYSSSSAEHSRRSSTVEKADDFQSCVDLQETPKNDSANNEGPNQNIPKIQNKDDETAKHIPLTDTGDLEESEIAKDILDKSDALKKLIEAKLESHPEYKLVSLHGEEFPSSSKSTEV